MMKYKISLDDENSKNKYQKCMLRVKQNYFNYNNKACWHNKIIKSYHLSLKIQAFKLTPQKPFKILLNPIKKTNQKIINPSKISWFLSLSLYIKLSSTQ